MLFGLALLFYIATIDTGVKHVLPRVAQTEVGGKLSAAAALTEPQIQSVLSLLSSFGVDQASIANTEASLRKVTWRLNMPPRPRGIEGFRDWQDAPDAAVKRLADMGLGTHISNLYWSYIESTPVASSLSPVQCPAGSKQYPANEAERVAQGYHRYHCYNNEDNLIGVYDRVFRTDAVNGIQSGVVLWNGPEQYLYSQCISQLSTPGPITWACVPRDDAMDDWEDFVNFLAARYNGGQYGKISHFIIWNESGSPEWFNYYPVVPGGTHAAALSTVQINMWIDKYADMMRRAYYAVARHTSESMIYASTDYLWDTPPSGPNRISGKVLLDGLWQRLGTSTEWAVAVHPYSDPVVDPEPGYYGFSNLQMVVDFATEHLRALGISNPDAYPQNYIIASEQVPFDNTNPDLTYRAQKLCQAHDVSLKVPNLLAVTESFRQSSASDTFSMIPYTVQPDLSNVLSSVTGQAYAAMDPAVWGKTDTNYCCVNTGLGCLYKPVTFSGSQASDSFNSDFAAQNAFDNNLGTSYSSQYFSTDQNDRNAFIAAWVNNGPVTVSQVTLTARMYNNAPTGFPVRYSIAFTLPDNSAWVSAGEFTQQPDSSGVVHITLGQSYTTHGILIRPITIGTDPGGGHYFQMREVGLR